MNLKQIHNFMMYYSQSKALFYIGEYYKQTYGSCVGGGEKR
jgi:hypothetical protein